MKKMTLIVIATLLVTGASGAYGYFFIYQSEDSDEVEVQQEQVQETNETVEEAPEEPEEPEEPPQEDNSSYFIGMKDECFEYDGMDRCWTIYVPNSTDDSRSIPLILDLHALQRSADNQYELSDMDRIAEENNAIVVYPHGYENSWNFGQCCDPANEAGIDDYGFLRTLIYHISDTFPADTGRVYMTGWSTGCAMAQAFANDASDILTAMACMSMYLLEEPSSGYNAIPIMEIHGLEDPIAPYGSLVTSSIIFQQQVWFTGAEQNLFEWKEMNGCTGDIPTLSETNAGYTVQEFTDCDNDSEVALVSLNLAAHNVYLKNDPGSPEPGNPGGVDTPQIAWDFLSRFSK